MMRSVRISCVLIATVALVFSSCNRKDEEDPTIKSYTLNGSSGPGPITVTVGSEIEVKATFNDDRALKGYRSDVHQNFDVHVHRTPDSEYLWQVIGDLDGKEYELDARIPIPADAVAGPHQFTMAVWDEEQKWSDEVKLELIVSNGSEPSVSLTQPTTATFGSGSTIPVAGIAQDETDIVSIELLVTAAGEEGDIGSFSGFYNTFWTIPNADDQQRDLADFVQGNDAIVVPTDIQGSYTLKVIVIDNEGNVATASADFEVL